MKFKIAIAGEEQVPTDPKERAQVSALWDSNAGKMNHLLQKHFGLDPRNRYMGSFPYADQNTGKPRVAWIISMESPKMRDEICTALNKAIKRSQLVDIIVLKTNEKPESRYKSPWPATIEIVAMGPSVTNTLVGELLIEKALDALGTSLS